MSSLGDLLLGKVNVEQSDSSPAIEDKSKEEKYKYCEDDQENGRKPGKSPSFDESNDANDQHQTNSQKVFPDRIEKNNIKVEECQSNASSTDDYVRELLDPNDRPRNVWHVVEGPKKSPADYEDRNDAYDRRRRYDDVDGPRSRQRIDADVKREHYDSSSPRSDGDDISRAQTRTGSNKRFKLEPTEDNKSDDETGPSKEAQLEPLEDSGANIDTGSSRRVKLESTEDNVADNLTHSPVNKEEQLHRKSTEDTEKDKAGKHDAESVKSSSRSKSRHEDVDKRRSHRGDSRERSTSSRRHHRDRHHDRDRDGRRDKGRDRHDDRDRRRSPGRHSKSRRRRDYTDDEDDDDHYRRHRGSRSRHHDRRSPSGSRSNSISRRGGRSKSNSQSPITKRNSRTILIMQLSPRVVAQDLEDFFSDIGQVREVRLIMDSKAKRHKGIAYIEFEDAASASKALTLNGQKFHGVPMQIQSARLDRVKGGDWHHASTTSHHHQQHHHHSSHHSSSTSHPSSRSTLIQPNSYRVYIGGLHVGITEDMLRTIVEPFGLIVKIELIKDRNTGVSRGYAFVTFASIEDGQEAIRNLNDFELAGKNLRVSKSTDKSDH